MNIYFPQPAYKLMRWILATGLILGLYAAQTPSAKLPPIALQPEPLKITPQEFYIADVTDERADRKAVAYLVTPATAPGQPATTQALDLEGGALTAIRQFMRQSVERNSNLRPVRVRVQTVQVTETAAANGRLDGRVSLLLQFDIQRNGKTLLTIPYKGGARYNRLPSQTALIEPTLRQSLVDGLNYLNTWMNREADKSEKLATGLKVHLTDVLEQDPDTVFYSPRRPLTWTDFKGQVRPGPSSAAVFPGFAYEGRSEVKEGIIHIYLRLKVYMVKNASWVRSGQDAYGLNHEQRHFDIVKMVAERFKQQVQPKHLALDDYNDMIGFQYFEALQEIQKLQEQYDSETNHSLNQSAQEQWNRRIDAELRTFLVKK